jgi:heat shock protein HslJ
MKYRIAGSRALAALLVLACCFGMVGTAEAALIPGDSSFTKISSAKPVEYHQDTEAHGRAASTLIAKFNEPQTPGILESAGFLHYVQNSGGDDAGFFRVTALSSPGLLHGSNSTSFREKLQERLSGLSLPGSHPGSFSIVSGTGVVRYIDIEDGFYGIIADDGTHYIPDSLPSDYQVDGIQVSFTGIAGQPGPDFRMWGKPLRLNTLELLSPGDEITSDGTVLYIDLEGGFYGIVADDGTHYYPLNLPAEYAKDGARVIFSARQEDVATTAMWGIPVIILSIDWLNAPENGSQLSGTWTLVEYSTPGSLKAVIPGSAISAEFGDENRVSGRSGCNLYSADYTVSGDDLTIELVRATLMYCTNEGVMQQETAYLGLLSKAARFSVLDEDLLIFDAQGNEILHFVKGAPDTDEKYVLVEFTRTGGFAGFNDALIIYQDGSAVVTRKEFTREITLTADELSTIRQLLQDASFGSLLPDYPPAAPGADYFTYTLTYEGKTVTAQDTGVPEALQPLIEELGTLVSENAPDDIAPPLR